MNQKYIWISLAVLIIGAGVVLALNYNSKSKVASVQPASEAMMEKEDPKMMSSDKINSDEVMMENYGSYKDYSENTVFSEQQAGNKVVLFFHAPWCPYCRSADAAFKANQEQIPTGVTVLKTDYDTNKELKTKYGVTTQHTFVQIDNSSNPVTKWVSGDIDLLAKNIK